MKKYKYTAINLDKKKFTGVFLAEDEQQLARRLAEQSLYLVKASPIKKTTASTFFSASGKVSANELATFCRQFAIMVTTGIPIVDALGILKAQSYSGLLKKTLEFVFEDVKSGLLLSQSLEKHKKIFPQFLRSMIYVGEISGALDKILVTLADYFETDARIKKKTKSAMIYPIILIFMAVGIIVLMVAFIIPTFMDALSSLDIEMPALTMALYNMSVAFQENWKKIVLIVLGAVLTIFLLLRTKKGKDVFDTFKLKAPVIGKITTDLVARVRFAHRRRHGRCGIDGNGSDRSREQIRRKAVQSGDRGRASGHEPDGGTRFLQIISAPYHTDDRRRRAHRLACRGADPFLSVL